MKRVLAFITGILISLVISSVDAANKWSFGGLVYTFPSSHGSGLLQNNGSGTLDWSGAEGTPPIAANIVMFTMNGSCPAGFTEYTTARGRYIVAMASGGTAGVTVGTALTNLENRPVGQHNHTASVSIGVYGSHDHGVSDPGHNHSSVSTKGEQFGCYDCDVETNAAADGNQLNSNTTGITISTTSTGVYLSQSGLSVNNAGSVAGTNAPYVQLMACVKS